MDYFSNYILFDQLQGTTPICTVKLMKEHFVRYGIPEEVVSDECPKFDNQVMKRLGSADTDSDGIAELSVK